MPISLTAIASGASVDADVLKARLATIETYVNEQIAAGDRTTNWLATNHVYTPDFQFGGGAGPRVIMPGGETNWAVRTTDRNRAAIFNGNVDDSYVPVPGLCRRIQCPEAPTTSYRVTIAATFYAFEYGGIGTGNAERDESIVTARFKLFLNGTAIDSTLRGIREASNTNAPQPFSGQIYARKQVTMFYADNGTYLNVGVNDIEIRCRANAPTTPATPEWKHILVWQGNLRIRHRVR